MKKFKDFIKEKNDMTPPLGDYNSYDNETLMILSRMAIENHFDDFINFFEKLARKDSNVKVELDNYLKDKTTKKPLKMRYQQEPDQIMMTRSDSTLDQEDE